MRISSIGDYQYENSQLLVILFDKESPSQELVIGVNE